MKFLALLKKELREAVPWIILAVISLLVLSWLEIRAAIRGQKRWFLSDITIGKTIDVFHSDIIQSSAPLMLYISILLGLALGIRHFWMPGFRGTWQFLIHRSVRRTTILFAKFMAVLIAMFFLSLTWIMLAVYTHISKKVIIPAESGRVILGIFNAYLGFLVYIGTSLCALTRARWYTTKMFGIPFVLIMFIFILIMPNLACAFIMAIIVFSVLMIQIYQIFLQREF